MRIIDFSVLAQQHGDNPDAGFVCGNASASATGAVLHHACTNEKTHDV